MIRRFFLVFSLAAVAGLAVGYCFVNDFFVEGVLIWTLFAVSMFLNGRGYGWAYLLGTVGVVLMY